MGYLFALLVNAGILKALIPNYFNFDLTITTSIAIFAILIFKILLRKRKLRNIFKGNLFFIFGSFTIFYLGVLVSCFYTQSPSFWKEKILRFAILNIQSFILPCLFFKLSDVKNFLRGSIVIFVIIIACYFSLIFKNGIKLFYFTSDLGLPSYLTWGSVIAFNSLIIIGILLENENINRIIIQILVSLFTLLCMSMIWIAGARGPFIFFIISAIIILLISKKTKLLALCFLIFCIISFLSFTTKSVTVDNKIGRSERIVNLSIHSTSVQKRLDYFKETWNHIKEEIFFGYGIGSFLYVTTGEDGRGYPHNIFLEVWFENGLFMVIMLFLFLFFLMFIAFKNINKTYMPTFLVINIYFVFSLMKSSSLTDARVFFAFSGILVATACVSKSPTTRIAGGLMKPPRRGHCRRESP